MSPVFRGRRSSHPPRAGRTPEPAAGGVRAADLTLPVLAGPAGRRPGRMARRRAAVLVGVHVLIAAHIAHWLLAGRTLSPAVLSDAMHTLENGEVNAGFVLFALAAAATVVVGRFLCGWGCHMGAMQDVCAWVLRRVGVRPRLMRSRVLGYVPVALALYMFAWPTFKREVAAPLLGAHRPALLPLLGQVHEFPGLHNRMLTDDLWARLPGAAVAVPFLLICGAATVYFLGARGFCRYGCPYGGVLSPLEQLAPGRVVVDPGACDGCARCTAACGAGVRVHEEVRAHGRVVSRHCVRTLDCVDACPKSALRLAWARPPAAGGRRAPGPRAAPDLSVLDEAAVAAAFAAAFFATRGAYGVVPMFMAVGVAICAAAAVWTCLGLARRRDVRLASSQLKRAGRLTARGAVFAGACALLGAFILQCAAVRVIHWRAGVADGAVLASRQAVFGGGVSPEDRAAAARALRLYRLGSPWADGGLGLTSTPSGDVRASWLSLVVGDDARAEKLLRRALRRGGETDGLCADLARVLHRRGRDAEALAHLEATHRRHPRFAECRDLLCAVYAAAGRHAEAESVLRGALAADARDAAARHHLASLLAATGRAGEAGAEWARAAADAADPHLLAAAAEGLFAVGRLDEATGALSRSAAADPAGAALRLGRGAEMLAAGGRDAEARAWQERARRAGEAGSGAR